MLFNSLEFFLFLPAVFILYWFVFNRSLRWQNMLVLVASYFFYGWWSWEFILPKQNSRFTDAQYKEFDRILSDYCVTKGCGFISGYSLPKSTVNFYDYSHFTREGSEAFGLQLRPSILEIIRKTNQER